MICVSCRAAGTANSVGDYAIAAMLHEGCTNCYCQHKTGANLYKKQALKNPPTREA
jgi:hypothetical protein